MTCAHANALAAWIVAMIVLAASCVSAAAQPVARADFEARMEALLPNDPMSYFELAEEVGVEWPDDAGRQLARELFVLAYEIDRRVEGRLGASVCLALADIAPDDDERRRLLALASMFRARAVDIAGRSGAGGAIAAREAAFSLATALGWYRSGDYARAAGILARPEVGGLLAAYGGAIGGADRVLLEIRTRPSCRQCRNQRVVRDTLNPNATERLCPTCNGLPGPRLTPEQFLMHLRLESMLLSEGAPSWSAQLIADQGAPLRVVDPEGLARRYGVDPARTLRRDGRWTVPPQEGGADARPVRADSDSDNEQRAEEHDEGGR